MRHYTILISSIIGGLLCSCSCEILDDSPEKYPDNPESVPLSEVARLFSSLPLETDHVQEVYDAVSSSSANGYDEEYTMSSLFSEPGAGVGDSPDSKSDEDRRSYAYPLRELISRHLKEQSSEAGVSGVKSSSSPEEYIDLLSSSDVQIYWPYCEDWDGESLPTITYDPDDGSSANEGFKLMRMPDGTISVEEVIVDEQTAMTSPVWVVNRNDDSEHMSLEMLRRQGPGGGIVVTPGGYGGLKGAAGGSGQALILRDFTMKRNYDPWFAGASEFFVKTGAVEDFCAVTEAEMKLYSPSITDFMIVVKRNQVGIPQPFNAVLVSEWTEGLTHSAFLITEDDGGTKTSWDCTAMVKVNSKSYGFELKIPLNRRDDIVWRGQLSRKFLWGNLGEVCHFGDVDITFDVLEY